MRHDKREKLKVTYSLKMAMLLVSLFLICTNYAVGEQPNLTIKGNITNIPPGTSNIYKQGQRPFSEQIIGAVRIQV